MAYTAIPNQGVTAYPATDESKTVYLVIASDTDLDSIKEEMYEAGLIGLDLDAKDIRFKDPDGDLAVACFNRLGRPYSLDLDMLTSAIDKCEFRGGNIQAVAAYAKSNSELDLSGFDAAYQGMFDSIGDYAEEHLMNNGMLHQVPVDLRMYIDFERYGKDLESAGTIWTEETGDGVHVFME